MKNPLVSIIVPNYNYARYLDKRLNSILNQSYDNFEIILLDDKSTDNSIEIIGKYKSHPKVSKVIVNESNSGSPFSQWKKGIEASNGEIVWIAESDDLSSPLFLEKMVKFYLDNDLVVAYCRSVVIDKDGTKKGIIQNKVTKDEVFKNNKKIFEPESIITNASSAIFNRKYAIEISNNYYEYRGAGDWLFWAGIAKKGKVGILAEPLNYYRVNSENTTSRLFINGTDHSELNRIYRYLVKDGFWNRSTYIRKRIKMSYEIKECLTFDSNTTRERLIEEWKFTGFFYSITDSFFKVINFLRINFSALRGKV